MFSDMINARALDFGLWDLGFGVVQRPKTQDQRPNSSRKYPPHARRFNNSSHGEYIRSGAQVGLVALGRVMHLVERGSDRRFECVVDLAFSPEERILILHPLVVTHRHATGIRENIR